MRGERNGEKRRIGRIPSQVHLTVFHKDNETTLPYQEFLTKIEKDIER